jgi:hypothetical protein
VLSAGTADSSAYVASSFRLLRSYVTSPSTGIYVCVYNVGAEIYYFQLLAMMLVVTSSFTDILLLCEAL